jgi:predicted ATPase with chaperone activity
MANPIAKDIERDWAFDLMAPMFKAHGIDAKRLDSAKARSLAKSCRSLELKRQAQLNAHLTSAQLLALTGLDPHTEPLLIQLRSLGFSQRAIHSVLRVAKASPICFASHESMSAALPSLASYADCLVLSMQAKT